jgi:hypothetical protein
MLWILLIICLLILILLFYELWLNNHPLRIGYVPSNLKLLTPFLEDITLRYEIDTNNSNLYEVGCGFAHVLRWYSHEYQWKSATGIELDLLWYKLSQLRNLNHSFKVVRSDAIHFNYLSQSVLYVYLTPEILEQMYHSNKLNGAFLISLTFLIPNVEPTEIISIKGIQHQVYVYDFRNSI